MKVITIAITPTGKTGNGRKQTSDTGVRAQCRCASIAIWRQNRGNTKVFCAVCYWKRLIKGRLLSLIHNADNLGPSLSFDTGTDRQKKVIMTYDIAPVMLPVYYKQVVLSDNSSLRECRRSGPHKPPTGRGRYLRKHSRDNK